MSQPNIIWITLDSVRPDHCSIEGYPRNTTPELQRIADHPAGSIHPLCIAHGRYTLVSTASIFTGTYPSRHRVGYKQQALPAGLPTVAELFSAAGYHTACLSANAFVSSGPGLDRGFDQFSYLEPKTLLQIAGIGTVAKYLVGIHRHSVGLQTQLNRHSTAFLTNEVAKKWLSSFQTGDDPFFFYIHYNEPHRPYFPPLPYLDEYTDEIAMSGREAAELAASIHDNLMKHIAEEYSLTDEQEAALIAMYDAELRYTDHCIGQLFDVIRSCEFEDIVVIITADHGELFGEQGLLGHKYVLDDALIHVPLVTYGLDSLTEEGLVQHSDVMKTLLAMAEARTAPIQGIDLRTEKRSYAIAQDHALDVEPLFEHNPMFDASHLPIDEKSVIRTEDFKLQLVGDESQLFKLPNEEDDVTEIFPNVAASLKEALQEWLETEGTPGEHRGAPEGEFTDSMRKHLADLGYLDGEVES